VAVVLIKPDDPDQAALAEKIYDELTARGIEPLLDDRNERPGVKFKDMDLIGLPLRITVGKLAAQGQVEFKRRTEKAAAVMTAQEAVDQVDRLVRAAK
jgi:prolyl-tRNA synthetase